MPSPFADIENSINDACIANIANAAADFGGGVTVSGIFGNNYAASFEMVAGAIPTFVCKASDVTTVSRGAAVTIRTVAYTVSDKQPDGTGMVLLVLKKA